MFKNKLTIILITLVCFLSAPVLQAQTRSQKQTIKYIEQEDVKKEQKKKKEDICGTPDEPIRVASFSTNPPLGWVDAIWSAREMTGYTGNGFAINLFEQLAKDENISFKVGAYSSYQNALEALQRGKIDILLGMYYNPKLTRFFNVIYPAYMNNPIIAVFKKGNEKPVQTFKDLVGLKGVVRQEELFYPIIYPSLPAGINVAQVFGAKEAFTGLMDGTYDYILTGLYNAETELRRFKLIDETVVSDTPLTQLQIFFAMSKKSECKNLKKPISDRLETLLKDPKAIHKLLIDNIDGWGKRFEDDPSLLEMLKTGEKDTTPSSEIPVLTEDAIPTVSQTKQSSEQPATLNTANAKTNRSVKTPRAQK